MKEKCCEKDKSRLGRVGGQAVIEGVMMKAGDRTVTTCRKEDGSLVVTDGHFTSVRKKHKILNIPILRGVINFVEMMILSVKTLGISADAMDLDVDKSGKKKEKEGSSALITAIMIIATVLGVALSLFLFMFLPNFLTGLVSEYLFDLGPWAAIIEGVLKIAIFISYLLLVSLMKDIRRTFMYHGAEHKSIACFEAGGELTPANAKNFKRFHPRCGTSFMFFMILIGIIAGLFVKLIFPYLPTLAYTGIRLAILPIVMGIGYEVIILAGKHDNIITRVLSAPGLWVQRITTKEPTEDMLEVAIISLKCSLRDEFPEFKEFYESKPWELSSANEESEDCLALPETNIDKDITDEDTAEIYDSMAASEAKAESASAEDTVPSSAEGGSEGELTAADTISEQPAASEEENDA